MTSFKLNELTDFARHYGFHYDIIDGVALARDFCADARRGLRGESSSMPMIPSRLRPVSSVPQGKTVIALDAGGTNLRAARIHFNEQNQPIVEEEWKAPMPGTQGHLDADAFYDAIAAVCAPLFNGTKIEGVGFCFSYPMEVTEDGDGLPLRFSKELDAPDAVGKPVGKGLRSALAKRGITVPDNIIILNDTTATLLSGIAAIPPRYQDLTSDTVRYGKDAVGTEVGPVIGFILGTGFNTAYPETVIPKINFESRDKAQIVVAESGTFAFRCRGELDREFDATTKNPGAYTTEKACSGAYLGPLTLHILQRAVRDGLLRFSNSELLLAMKSLQTRELNEFLYNPLALSGTLGGLFTKDDLDAIEGVAFLTTIISERAALLSAAILAGTVELAGGGYEAHAPVRIAVEGTTYARFFHLRKALESRFHTILSATAPRHVIIQPVEQGSLFGAAVAAFS